jgi:ribonuclease P protein component
MTPAPTGRIRGRAAFAELRHPTGRATRGAVRVRHVAPGDRPGCDSALVAYALGRAFGTAVQRNRGRRRLRAVVAELGPELPPGSYLLSADTRVTDMNYPQLTSDVREAMLAAARDTARPLAGATPASGRTR